MKKNVMKLASTWIIWMMLLNSFASALTVMVNGTKYNVSTELYTATAFAKSKGITNQPFS